MDFAPTATIVELAKLGDGRDVGFALALVLPEWPWVQAPQIADDDETRDSLYREVYTLHGRLTAIKQGASAEAFIAEVRSTTAAYVQASELRGKPYTFLTEMTDALQGRPIGGRPEHSVHLTELPRLTGMEVFAGGRLVRVRTDSHAVIRFDSSLPDGAWGGSGGTYLACDLWYRQDAAGKWILDAVVPQTSTHIHLGARVTNVDEEGLRELFKCSPF